MGGDGPLGAWNRRCNTPLVAHRGKGRNGLFHLPEPGGRCRQGAPMPTLQKTASRNRRLSPAVGSRSVALPGGSGAISCQGPSLMTKRCWVMANLLSQGSSTPSHPWQPFCPQALALALCCVSSLFFHVSKRRRINDTKRGRWSTLIHASRCDSIDTMSKLWVEWIPPNQDQTALVVPRTTFTSFGQGRDQ